MTDHYFCQRDSVTLSCARESRLQNERALRTPLDVTRPMAGDGVGCRSVQESSPPTV